MAPRGAWAALAVLALIAAGCGGAASAGSTSKAPSAGSRTTGAFAWLRPSAGPAQWPTARIPSGATMPYPPGWRPVAGDRGTATVARLSGPNDYVGYLNLTPRQGGETLAGWARFRIEHNADEGDRNVTPLAAATGQRFVDGTGTCVTDEYTTSTGTRYIEIACLVAGRRGGVVIVGATPPQDWAHVAPSLERAITAVTV